MLFVNYIIFNQLIAFSVKYQNFLLIIGLSHRLMRINTPINGLKGSVWSSWSTTLVLLFGATLLWAASSTPESPRIMRGLDRVALFGTVWVFKICVGPPLSLHVEQGTDCARRSLGGSGGGDLFCIVEGLLTFWRLLFPPSSPKIEAWPVPSA